MANIDNLTNFLEDVANAIKTKKGYPDAQLIPAENFDTEISDIATGTVVEKVVTEASKVVEDENAVKVASTPIPEPVVIPENGVAEVLTDKALLAESIGLTPEKIVEGNTILNVEGTGEGGGSGGDTSDATATASDILFPKTAYTANGKVIGGIQSTYDIIRNTLSYTKIKLSNDVLIRDILDEYNLAIVTKTLTKVFYIYKWENNELGDLLLTVDLDEYTTNIAMTAIQNISFSKTIDENGNLVIHLTDNARYMCIEISIDGTKILQFAIANSSTGTNYMVHHDMAVNPVYAHVCAYGYRSEDDGYSTYHRYNIDTVRYNASGNTITLTRHYFDRQNDQGTSNRIQWDQSGTLCLLSCNYKSNLLYLLLRWNITFTSCSVLINTGNGDGDGKAKCLWKNDYIFANNSIRKVTSYGTIIKSYTENDLNNEITSSSMLWTYSNFLFNFNRTRNMLYCYKIDETTLDLNKMWGISMVYTDYYSRGTLYFPTTNHCLYFVENNVNMYKFISSSEYHILKTIELDGYKLYNTNDSNANAANVLSGKKYYGKNGEQIGTMQNNGQLVYDPSIEEQSIPEGYTSGGKINPVTSDIDINIIPENIRKGATILDVEGTFEGSTGGDATSDGNLQAKYLLEGYSAIVDGKLIEGTMKENGIKTIIATNEDIEISEGHYNSLSIPVINAINCADYAECKETILSI